MKGRIVGIGACVLDTLITLPHYPTEDTKLRATATKQVGGGPVATGLVAAAKLGADTAFLGNLSSDAGGAFLKADFQKYGVGTQHVSLLAGFRPFTSFIWLSEKDGTRTCVFDKGNLPPLSLSKEQEIAIREADLLMVDGNEMEAALAAATVAKESGTKVLYDCGGLYEGVEKLLAKTDIMIPSEEFALGHTGKDSAEEAAKRLFELYRPEVVVVTRGKEGGVLYDGKELLAYPIYPIDVVDSNGSGDVFHGAFAFAATAGYDYPKCCHFASAVSALKCGGVGARESAPTFAEVKEYMKENGYEL